MRYLALALSLYASAAYAQQPNGIINAPIYATGYISVAGGTNVTTKIPAQPNHPANQNVYLTSAVTGTWSIQLPNPAFEGQVLSFNCGNSASAVAVTSTDGSSLDSSIPTSCNGNSGFVVQFDQRDNIWRNLGSNATILAGVTVNNNTQLTALPSPIVTATRLGYAAAGDAPAITYTRSNSICSLNAGAGDGGYQVPGSNSTCWIATLPSPADVRIWGAKLDGVTDDAAKLNAAASAAGTILIPAGMNAYAASTVSVNPPHALVGGNFEPGVYPTATSSRITCGVSVSPCVQSIGGPNGTSQFSNIIVARNGTPSSGVIGLLIQDNQYIVLNNVMALNHGVCIEFEAQVYNTSAGIGANAYGLYADKCADAYLFNKSWPELRVFGGRFSSTGLSPNTFVRYSGGTAGTAGGPNTTSFINFHFGANRGYPIHAFEYTNLGAGGVGAIDAREFYLFGVHIEGIPAGGAIFYSDSTWDYLDRFTIANSEFLTPSANIFALNAATAIKAWNITGSRISGSSFTLAPTGELTGLNMTGNWIQAPVSITAGSSGYGSIVGNQFYGNVTYAGTWQRLNTCANTMVSGSITMSITGTPARCDQGYAWNTGGQPLTVSALAPSSGLYFSGSQPTCSVTGAGASATCPFSGSSNANNGVFNITAGSGASSSGTLTLTFASAFSGSSTPVCNVWNENTGTASWSAAAVKPRITAKSTSAITASWDNGGSALVNGSTYAIAWHCFGK